MKHVESTPLCVGFVWLSIGYIKVEYDDGSRGVANGQIISGDLQSCYVPILSFGVVYFV